MRSRSDFSAIVVPASPPNGYGILRSLSEAGISVLALDHHPAPVRFSRLCRHRTIVDPDQDAEGFLAELESIAGEAHEPPVLFPTQDFHATVIQQAGARLAGTMRYSFMAWSRFLPCVDKRGMLEAAVRAGLTVPESWWPENPDALHQLLPRLGRYPYVLKPAAKFEWREGRPSGNFAFYNHYGTKALSTRDPAELVSRYDDAYRRGFSMIVQQEIPGPPHRLVAMDFYTDAGGAVQARHTGRKLRQHPTDFGTCTLGRSEVLPELWDPCARLVSEIGFRGLGNIEFKEGDGRLYFMELNPRAWMWIHLATAAGVNLPEVAYRDLRGESLPISTRALRRIDWLDLRLDLEHLHPGHGEGGLEVGEWLRSLAGVRVEARCALTDPLPALVAGASALGRRARGNRPRFRTTS